jgi:hypothetical protein
MPIPALTNSGAANALFPKGGSPELSPRAPHDPSGFIGPQKCRHIWRPRGLAISSSVVSITRADEDRVLTWLAFTPTRNLTVRGAS